MQLQSRFPRRPGSVESFSIDGRSIPLAVVHSPRASRYRLRAFPDGSVRLTVPRGGSVAEARRFAERNTAWIQRQLQFFASRPTRPKEWFVGTEIPFRGNFTPILANDGDRSVRVADETIAVANASADLRGEIETHLRRIAARELPPRVRDFAGLHRLIVRRISIRNQRTRWGSCSPGGGISLNWRLVQTPPFVRDYIILHELMHLRQMNHSPRFWREVERVCPDYEVARQWLKQNSGFLRGD